MVIFSNLDWNRDKELADKEMSWIIDSIAHFTGWVDQSVQTQEANLLADCDEDYNGFYNLSETEKAWKGMIKIVNDHSGAC